MEIYNYDPATKIFTCVTEADKSPLEENVYLVPAHATINPVPSHTENQYAFWNGTSWEIKNIVTPIPSEEEQLFLCKSEAKKRLLSTDWTQYGDVAETLLNKSAFDDYRNQVRTLFLRPIIKPDWPVEPVAEWSL